jgi:beta-galactosidase GanA
MPAHPRLRRRLTVLGAAAALVLGLTSGAHAATPTADATPHVAHTVTYDGYSFMIDGKRTYIWSGEFHYFRLPNQDLWRDVLEKMKAAGFNATSLYFDWGYHSPAPGVYDFTGVRDVDKLLDIAQQVGIYVIARPGPYINAEVDGGGFPGWLSAKPGATRTSDPIYLK